MIRLTGAEVAALTGGVLVAHDGATGGRIEEVVVDGPVVVDSRRTKARSLFVALAGEHADGHGFGREAAAAGATLALGERPLAGLPTVVVGSSVEALALLAHGVLARLPGAQVVGVTGSAGKTTTKDLLATLLAADGPTVAPPGSYNNEIGLPLTVLSADETTQHLVLEMGARGVGHVRALTEVARPHVGVVLNVGSAHLGEFGSPDAVAVAKGELVEALPPDGIAVLSSDDARVAAMVTRTAATVVTFGRSPSATVRADDVVVDRGLASFRLVSPQGSADVALRLVGEHQVGNALAAAAVALSYGMPPAEVGRLLSGATPASRWRMEVTERSDGVTVVNDAYNANPESMAAALETLAAMAAGRRSWAVLGEMRELGPTSAQAHEQAGRLAARLKLSRLVVVGEAAAPLLEGASSAGEWAEPPLIVPDVDTAISLMRARVEPGDVVLVKASRGVGLDRLATALLEGGDG